MWLVVAWLTTPARRHRAWRSIPPRGKLRPRSLMWSSQSCSPATGQTSSTAASTTMKRIEGEGRIRLLADHLDHEVALSGPRVEIHHDDLLPRAEQQRAVGERDGHRRDLQVPPQVAVGVVLAGIAGVVLPARVVRDQAVPYRLGIGADARLVLDEHHGSGGGPDEDRGDPGR